MPSSQRTARSIAPAIRSGSRVLDRAQREHDLGGVVDIRVVDVGELERPSPGRERGTAYRPVATAGDLLAEQPIGGSDDRLVVAGDAGVGQRDQGQRGVPDRRLAGLEPAEGRAPRCVNRSSPARPRAITGWSSGYPRRCSAMSE